MREWGLEGGRNWKGERGMREQGIGMMKKGRRVSDEKMGGLEEGK